jgi:3-oxosteroid 1-dehydrogenase
MDRAGSYDLIVVGAGLAGLAAALAAGQFGLRTLVLEKASKIGGGSATSLGALWIGDSHVADAAGFRDSRTEVRDYMRFVGGDQVDDARLEAYIGQAPEAVRFFERCGVRFRVVDGLVDNYHGIAPGAVATGRYLEAELISAGPLADSLYLQPIVPPHMTLQELIAWGGVANPNGWDQELIEQRRRAGLYGRGAGLIAHFLAQARTRGVTTRTSAAVASLLTKGDRVVGVTTSDGEDILASRGVILTTGGYESNPELAQTYEGLPGWRSIFPPGITGDGLVMATEIGASVEIIHNNMAVFLGIMRVGDEADAGASYYPVSSAQMTCPHTIVVDRLGQRFADEAYFQNLVPRLREYAPTQHAHKNLPCYLIFDSQYGRNFSFAGQPVGAPIPAWVTSAASPPELGKRLAIDGEGLASTIARFNGFAATGVDEDFGRGQKAWRLGRRDNWHNSGGHVPPNPSLGALAEPPFYGIELHPSAFCSAGLRADHHARVLGQRGKPIPGLYAAGNAAAHTEYGVGYQAGYSLGSALAFGYVAACHIRDTNE